MIGNTHRPALIARAGRRGLAPCLALALPAAFAQPAVPVTADGDPPSVVVTVSGVAQSGIDTPAAVDTIAGRTLREAQRQVNLSETLARVPGLHIADRQNYAQDLQISSRGFGARSTFGVRGIRLYADGIPASMPDGSGQVSHFALSSAARVEVLRGPFSVLHGNAAGGVIAIVSEDAPPGLRATPSFSLGSFNTWRAGMQLAGTEGRVGYVLDASRFATDGARDRGAATRELQNARLKFRLGEATTLTVTGNRVDMPASQDPLGLTRAEFNANPDQASPVAITFNTRKSTRQVQGGALLEHAYSTAHQLRISVYGGERAVNQYQAIPTGAQAAATHPGGVIDLDRAFHGIDARWIHRGFAADGATLLTIGASREVQDELRRGFRNFIGAPATPTSVGVLGALRRDEANRVVATSLFAQGEWQVLPALKVSVGVRRSRVAFASADRFIAAGNPDDSGAVAYRATTPAAGVVWSVTDAINAYAAVGRGFETPTFNELAYSPTGASGLNFTLKAATSRHVEAGLKARFNGGYANLALFTADTADEIVTAANTGGRAVFQNAGKTARKGLEAAVSWRGASGFSAYGAFTLIEAKYVDAFRTCLGPPPCAPAAAVTVDGGTDMPGIPRRSLHAELAWRAPRALAAGTPHAALEVRTTSQVRVDDRGSDAASGYTVAGARIGLARRAGEASLSGFARVDNLGNARYAGSVIVNESNGRYFESAPGRHWTVGATLAWRIR